MGQISDLKSSRHSSIANSQSMHHHYIPTRHSAHTLTNRSSVTPTPTYDVTHSQAVYYQPHLSNVSTATYSINDDAVQPNIALTAQRGSSFYSNASSVQHPPFSHHSLNSNQSMHSNASSYHKYAQSGNQINASYDNPYNHHPPAIHQRHSSHHNHHHHNHHHNKYRESSPYNDNDSYYAAHKVVRNKRYRQHSSRHKKPQ